MDKNEYKVKLDEIEKCVDAGNYAEAARLADQVDWKRVRNVRTLCLVSEIYEAENRYEDSKALLLRAYRRTPVGRAILYRLVEVTIKLKQFDEAIEYYSEYVQAAPHDTGRYILKYKIYRGRGSSVEEQIQILKEYLDQEYNEKYAYELARLYEEADRIPDCLNTVDDLVLWFHSGKYVTKALELKKKYAALTPKQQEIYDHRFEEDPGEDEIGQEKQIVGTEDTSLAESIVEDTTREIADEVARAAEDLQEEEAGAAEEAETAEPIAPEAPESAKAGDLSEEEPAQEEKDLQMPEEAAEASALETAGEETLEAGSAAEGGEEILPEEAEEDGLSRFTTKELQTEMIRSMREIVSGVGIRDTQDADQEEMDRVIEQSKQDQEEIPGAASALPGNGGDAFEDSDLQQIPEDAHVSMDDVLLSMGEKGSAVREAASKAGSPVRPQPEGVLSAVDEALLNMGVRDAEQLGAQAASQARKAAREAAREAEEELAQDTGALEAAAGDAVDVMSGMPEEAAGEAAEEAVEMAEEAAEETAGMAEEAAGKADIAAEAAGAAEEISQAAAGSAETDAPEMADETQQERDRIEEEAIRAFEGRVDQEIEEAGGKQEDPENFDDDIRILEKTPHASDREAAKEEAPAREEKAPEPAAAGGRKDAGQDLSMEEIIGARTRRIPTQEIAQEMAQDEEAQEEREKDGKKYLKDSLRGFFDGYLQIQNMERQIGAAIDQALKKGADRTSRTGNILIFGGHGCGKTTIATGLAKAIAQEQGKQFVKMAKIYATDLNRKDIAATVAKIAGGVLIVEEAGDLDDGVADQLTTAMEFRTDGLIIILEDEQRYMHDLLMRHPRLTMKFTSQIYIPVFTVEELAEFGKLYADDHDYVISEDAAAALSTKISAMAAQGDVLSITNVLDLVDQAMARANKFTRKLFAGKKRYDSQGRIVLLEKDFR